MKIATWNIGSALKYDFDESIKYIAENAEKNSVDILCLQEVVTSGSTRNFINELKKELGFNFSSYYELSSAHLENQNINLGIAILSKYRILNSYNFNITNPQIVYYKKGREIKSDNKGFLASDIEFNGKTIKVFTGHMLPFHSLGSDSREYQYLYKEMYAKVKSLSNNDFCVLCGDFNSSKLEELIPEITSEMFNVFNSPTRYNGAQNDYIYLSHDLESKYFSVNMNDYDHFLCVCDIEIKNNEYINILHLSDIHFLSKDYRIDEKTNLSKVKDSDIRKTVFYEKIKTIKSKIDYVVVSGDITTYGMKEGFDRFDSFISEMQNDKIFPPSNRIIIVPGNHDTTNDKKFEDFANMLNASFVRPWIEELDESPYKLIHHFNDYIINSTESVFGFIEDRITFKKIHIPLIIDKKKKTIIYAFNSSSISNTRILLSDEDSSFIKQIKAKKQSKDLKRLLNILENEFKVDPARIDPQEFFIFNEFFKTLNKYMDISRYQKIAVLHHHTTTISCNEEIKKFDNIINAGILKKNLTDKGFQLILHGHKHNPDVFIDSATETHQKLIVASGGTIFGYSNNNTPGFYLHNIRKNTIASYYHILDENKAAIKTMTKLTNGFIPGVDLCLRDFLDSIKNRVIQHLNKETINGKDYWGWSKNIEERRVGVISTVYGLLILEHLHCDNKYYCKYKDKLIESLWQFRHKSGGWGAVSQITKNGAPEATAWVTLAFYTVKSKLYKIALNDLYSILNRMDKEINSNFTLSLIINILCKVDPESPFISRYCQRLINSAIKKDGKILYWYNNCNTKLMRNLKISIPSTALAVIALCNSVEIGQFSLDIKSEMVEIYKTLINKDLWVNTHEAISIQIGEKEDSLIVHYYTIAWVIKALLKIDNQIDIVDSALKQMIKDYNSGYWNYDGNNYIWTLYDALSAIEMYLFETK